MGSCTAQCKMLLFCANTVVRESAKFELARLKKEEEEEEEEEGEGEGEGEEEEEEEEDEEEEENRFGDFLARYFRDGYSRHWESSGPGKHSKTNSKLS